jgi:hypothetical protein
MIKRALLVAVFLSAGLLTAPTLVGCGGGCSGNVVKRTPSGNSVTLHIHRSLGSNKSDFCDVRGTASRLQDCLVGSVYPKCSK